MSRAATPEERAGWKAINACIPDSTMRVDLEGAKDLLRDGTGRTPAQYAAAVVAFTTKIRAHYEANPPRLTHTVVKVPT